MHTPTRVDTGWVRATSPTVVTGGYRQSVPERASVPGVLVYAELPEELDVPEWTVRHARGEVPDATPYGLHRLVAPGVSVGYRTPLRHRGLAVLGGKARGRLAGTELVAGVLAVRDPVRRGADVVLCMDERTGLPAALTPGGPPVVSGIAWLERPASVGRAHAAIARRALRRAAGLFTQSPGLAPCLAQAWDVSPDRVHEIRLGIDADFYAQAPWPEDSPGGGGVVASVGDDRMRDHGTLVAAITRLRADGVPARLELATTQPVRVPSDVGVLHARRMGAAMRAVYARAAVVAVALHPNTAGSGLTVALEAMATGRPVVITGNPGVEAYVRHGETGLLVPPHDPLALADAVGELLADPRRAEKLGRAGRTLVEHSFTSAHMAADLRHVLHTALTTT
jgi:glycosyltransferase involved in cell wall biosynthesis